MERQHQGSYVDLAPEDRDAPSLNTPSPQQWDDDRDAYQTNGLCVICLLSIHPEWALTCSSRSLRPPLSPLPAVEATFSLKTNEKSS